MGSSLLDIPFVLILASSFKNNKEIAFKTIPSATKVEIKTVLESMYGFEIEKVRTLNMMGKKKKMGGRLVAKPNYKKAYITLKNPLASSQDLFSARATEKKTPDATQDNVDLAA